LPTPEPDNVAARVGTAKMKFRRYRSSDSDRRDAIRDLADVFEYLRPQLQEVLTNKDDKVLFNIANNFSIRHHNVQQQGTYDKTIWYSWMFHFYLASIHACLRFLEKQKPRLHVEKMITGVGEGRDGWLSKLRSGAYPSGYEPRFDLAPPVLAIWPREAGERLMAHCTPISAVMLTLPD
jgi:hypothetical protein